MSPELEAMRADNVAAWRRDVVLSDYQRVVVDSTSRYLPALEAEVERLRSATDIVERIMTMHRDISACLCWVCRDGRAAGLRGHRRDLDDERYGFVRVDMDRRR